MSIRLRHLLPLGYVGAALAAVNPATQDARLPLLRSPAASVSCYDRAFAGDTIALLRVHLDSAVNWIADNDRDGLWDEAQLAVVANGNSSHGIDSLILYYVSDSVRHQDGHHAVARTSPEGRELQEFYTSRTAQCKVRAPYVERDTPQIH